MGGRARLPPLGNQVLIYLMYRDEIVGMSLNPRLTKDGVGMVVEGRLLVSRRLQTDIVIVVAPNISSSKEIIHFGSSCNSTRS